MKVLVTGASGPIGGAVLSSLNAAGHQVTRLVRRAPAPGELQWDPMRPVPPETVSGFDGIIHLAGESIVGHWNEKKKQRIRDSRVIGTRNLAQALLRASPPPRVFITASAIGYYGSRGDEMLSESANPGSAFLSTVCREWEAASRLAEPAGIRTVQLRIGIMLSPEGGALKQMLTPFRRGLGGIVGNGKQYWSWVSIDDVAGAILHALEHDDVRGPVNVVSPNPVTNIDFTRALAKVLRRPALFPISPFMVRLFFGQMGEELLLASARVMPVKLEASGYKFRQTDLQPALAALLRK